MIAWLRLLRASGACTIGSNVLAAIAASGLATGHDLRQLALQVARNVDQGVWVVVVGLGSYACGMLWNDLADIERDRLLAPARPLPSGRIDPAQAWVLALFLPTLTLLASTMLGERGVLGAGIILGLVLLYDGVTKHVPWVGALNLALVRAGHAVFALLVLGHDEFDRAVLAYADLASGAPGGDIPLYPLLLGTYIFGLGLCAELESRTGFRWELIVGGLVLLAPLFAVAVLAPGSRLFGLLYLDRQFLLLGLALAITAIAVVVLAVRLIRAWYQAVVAGEKRRVPKLVIGALGGMILFDAAIASLVQPVVAVVILALLLPFTALSALARMD